MGAETQTDNFYAGVPIFRGFANVVDLERYQPLPDDWLIGIADVTDSTKAVQANRYKAVNMAGAAVIVSVTNALQHRDFPFVFGGDGASFAVPAAAAGIARDALAATATWVNENLDLTLRVGLVPIAAVRAQGSDVLVARFAASDNVALAMFAGGGLAWADAAVKAGEFAVPAAPSGAHPDLSGLSCRFEEIPAVRGIILSILVTPVAGAKAEDIRRVVESIIGLTERNPDASGPIPQEAPRLRWPPRGLDLEARAQRRAGESLILRKAKLLVWTLMSYLIFRFGIAAGGFSPQKYLKELVENSDFRKFDDTLRMVIDCTPELADEIERMLTAASGTVRFGLHRQDKAMMTCFTPSPINANHVHFIDGALGGYTSAATALKASSDQRPGVAVCAAAR
jgi:hypothetical protein